MRVRFISYSEGVRLSFTLPTEQTVLTVTDRHVHLLKIQTFVKTVTMGPPKNLRAQHAGPILNSLLKIAGKHTEKPQKERTTKIVCICICTITATESRPSLM